MSERVIEKIQKVAQSIVDVLESKNLEDELDINPSVSWELNTDFYDGKIEGRDEAILLIKKAFQLDKEGE